MNRSNQIKTKKQQQNIKQSIKKEWTEATIFFIYKCITANNSAIWQHAAQTTDQLTTASC